MIVSKLTEARALFLIQTWAENLVDEEVEPTTERAQQLYNLLFVGRDPEPSVRKPEGPLISWLQQVPASRYLHVPGLSGVMDHKKASLAVKMDQRAAGIDGYPAVISEGETGRLGVSWRQVADVVNLEPGLVRQQVERYEDNPAWAVTTKSRGLTGKGRPRAIPGLTLRTRHDKARALGVPLSMRYYRLNPHFTADLLSAIPRTAPTGPGPLSLALGREEWDSD